MADITYQTESGFGSMTFANIEEPAYDRGWGDPVEDSEEIFSRDTFYGSPFDGYDIGASIYGYSKFGEDGGEFIKIFGLWNLVSPAPALSPTGPFLVSVIDSEGTETRCKSALAGLGYACLSDASQRILKASLPVLPVGVYDVKIYYGENYSSTVTLDQVIEIVPTNRSFSAVSIAKSMPNFYNTIKTYSAPKPSSYAELGPLQALVSAIGEEVDKISGKSYTLLTQELSVSATEAFVESTLSLKESGVVYIGKDKFFYSSKTNTSLQGLIFLSPLRRVIPAGEKVVLDVYNWESGNDSK